MIEPLLTHRALTEQNPDSLYNHPSNASPRASTKTASIHIPAATRNPRGEGMDEEIPTWMRLFALYRSCTLKSYAHLCTQISRAPWRPLSDWHAGRPAVAPCMSSQWGGLAGVVPVHRVGQCLCHWGIGKIARS